MKGAATHKRSYKTLIAFQKAEVIYDMTYYFCNKYLRRGDRTIDQMVQAARSGKQNIVEGVEAAVTSYETLLKLLNEGGYREKLTRERLSHRNGE